MAPQVLPAHSHSSFRDLLLHSAEGLGRRSAAAQWPDPVLSNLILEDKRGCVKEGLPGFEKAEAGVERFRMVKTPNWN